MINNALRTAVGVGLGGLTALAELLYLVLSALLLVVPAARPAIFRGARRFARAERDRLRLFLAYVHGNDFDGRRSLQYLVPRSLVGLLALGVWACVGAGVVTAVFYARQLVTGRAPGGQGAGTVADWLLIAGLAAIAGFLCGQGIAGVAEMDRRLARRFLGPSPREMLLRQICYLATSRAELVEAVDDERRRIERDLHDGVQQRLVALGMLLGRARRPPGRAAELLRQAHEQAQRALVDLREVSWRVYPAALDTSGLATALESVAERARCRCDQCELPAEPPAAVRAVGVVRGLRGGDERGQALRRDAHHGRRPPRRTG